MVLTLREHRPMHGLVWGLAARAPAALEGAMRRSPFAGRSDGRSRRGGAAASPSGAQNDGRSENSEPLSLDEGASRPSAGRAVVTPPLRV
jgi:hypothetical protein